MAFKDCIADAVRQGAISTEEGDDLVRRYDAHARANRASDDPRGAEGVAKDALAKELTDEAARKRRLADLSAERTTALRDFLIDYRDTSGRPDVLRAAMAVLENRNNELAGTASVVGRREALTGYVHGRLEASLYEHRRSFGLGRRLNRARLSNVVDEAFGAGTAGDAARGFLDAWRAQADELVDRFNAAGGEIHKRDQYFPQRHDARRLAAAGEEAWTTFITPKLDTAAMADPLTGGPLTPERLREALHVIYRRIVTDGAIDIAPSGQPRGRGALANQRQEERFLAFRSAGAWRDYAEAFGSTDVFAVMMEHLHGLAKDVAALEILGPNPNATVEWLRQVVQQEAARAKLGEPSLYRGTPGGTASGRLSAGDDRLGNLWTVVNGSVGSGNLNAADLMEAARNVVGATNLAGTAVTSVLGDPWQQAWARRFAGLSSFRWLADVTRQALSGQSRREIVRAGIIMEDALDHLGTSFRDLSWAARSKEASRWLPDRVFAWTGLTPWTRVNRRSQAFGFMFEAGDRTGQSLAQIAADGTDGERFARFLRGFGVDDTAWDAIRQTAGTDHGEAGRLLRPVDIIAAAPRDQAMFDLAMRYSEAVHAFVEEAVPSGTARARTRLGAHQAKGTLPGEAVRALTSYWSYPASMLMSLARATSLEASAGGLGRGTGFLASAVAGLTVGGAMILQSRALRAGKDPEPVDSPAFWLRALAAGGAGGFYGDWLLADYSRGVADTAARFAGPVVGSGLQLVAALGPSSLAADRDINRAARLTAFGRRSTPVQNMWWLRPVTERLIWDRLQAVADPKAAANWARKQREAAKAGQGVWWRQGQALPDRAPQFDTLY